MARRVAVRDFGKSALFNGTSSGVQLTGYTMPAAFSISLWINTTKYAVSDRIVDWSDSGPSSGFNLLYGTNEQLAFTIYNGAVAEAVVVTTAPIRKGTWNHIVVTFTTNSAKIYKNGVLQNTDTGCTMAIPTQTVTIGKRSAGASNFFGGNLAEFILHERVLTQSEINELYYAGTVPSTPEFVISFNDTLSDSSENQNALTLVGSLSYTTNTPTRTRTPATSRTTATNRVAVRDMGTALRFVATTDKVSVPITLSQDAFSFSFWITQKAPMRANETLFSQPGSLSLFRQSTNDMQMYAFLNAPVTFATPRRLRFRNFTFPGTRTSSSVSRGFGTTPQFKTYVVYVTAGVALCDEYINGIKIGSTHNVDYTGDTGTPSGDITIGNENGTSHASNSIIDEPRIWNRALTATEIQNLYLYGAVPQDGLVAEYLFNEASGTTAYDTSGNGNDGTITGATYTTDVPLTLRDSI